MGDQDSREARHQGRSEELLRSGDEGEGEASQDRREGLPSLRAQETDLRGSSLWQHVVGVPETLLPWESHGAGLGISLSMQVTKALIGIVHAPSGQCHSKAKRK